TIDDGSCIFSDCDYGNVNIILDQETQIVDTTTEINIFFDASGSMNTTLPKLQQMRDQYLKACLLPFFNGDEDLYSRRVKIIGGSGNANGNWTLERTFAGIIGSQGPLLQRIGSSPEITQVINLVFQDEANSSYHPSLTSFVVNNVPTASFINDIGGFKQVLADHPKSYYRAVIFQVNGSNGFKGFLDAVENGKGAYADPALNLKNVSDQIKIKYDITAAEDPTYYLRLVRETLGELGYNIPAC